MSDLQSDVSFALRQKQSTPLKVKETFTLARDERIVARLAEPRGSRLSEVGVVIWGMGIAELRAAMQFAEIGWPALQICSLSQQTQMETHGVDLCQNAVSELQDRFPIDRFLLMGNCSNASVCINTALIDSRVVGLIMTNPAITKSRLLSAHYRNRLFSWRAWKHVLLGRANFRKHFSNVRTIRDSVKEKLSNSVGLSRNIPAPGRKDTVMPTSLRKRFLQLTNKSVRILVVCSEGDISHARLKVVFGEDLERFLALPNCTFELLPKAPHMISRDDSASTTLIEKVLQWVKTASFAPEVRAFGDEAESQINARISSS